MEGKVELPIERYEELTKIERDGFAKVKELEANIDKIMVISAVYGWNSEVNTKTEYKIKDEVINDLIDTKEKAVKAKYEAVKEKKAVIQKYNEASFWKRFRYLWTKEL